MMTPEEVATCWCKVVEVYKGTFEKNNPEYTMKEILKEIHLDQAKETFAAVSAIKKSDGRIYGYNRDVMNSIPVDPRCLEWNRSNPLLTEKLDEIHTAHINNLITVLVSEMKKAGEL